MYSFSSIQIGNSVSKERERKKKKTLKIDNGWINSPLALTPKRDVRYNKAALIMSG